MKAIEDVLLLQLHAIENTARKIGHSDPMIAAALNDMGETIKSGFERIMQQHVEDVLSGDGPVAQLHNKLSTANGKTGNHFEVVDQRDRLTYSDVIASLKKYLSTTVTRFDDGGPAEPVFKRLEGNFNLCSFDDLSGFYVNVSGYTNKNQIILSMDNGHGLYSHVVITLETQFRLHGCGSVTIRIHSYHPMEQLWVTHDRWELIDKNRFDRALVQLLKQNSLEVPLT